MSIHPKNCTASLLPGIWVPTTDCTENLTIETLTSYPSCWCEVCVVQLMFVRVCVCVVVCARVCTSGCVEWSWLALMSSLGRVVCMLGGLRKRLSSCCWLSLRLWMMLHDCCCFCSRERESSKRESSKDTIQHRTNHKSYGTVYTNMTSVYSVGEVTGEWILTKLNRTIGSLKIQNYTIGSSFKHDCCCYCRRVSAVGPHKTPYSTKQ